MTYFFTGNPRRTLSIVTTLSLAAVLAMVATTSAVAEQADRSKPLVYSADHLSYDDLKQTTILTGNVELTKGTIVVRGDRAEIRQDPEGYSYATATSEKGLSYIREKRDGVNEYFEGNAKRIDYDGKNDISTLTGQAVARRLQGLTKPIDEVHGSAIRYDGQTGFYTATSNGSTTTNSAGGRVRGMIAPTTTAPAPAGDDDSASNTIGDSSATGNTGSAAVDTSKRTSGTSNTSKRGTATTPLPASATTLTPAQSLEDDE